MIRDFNAALDVAGTAIRAAAREDVRLHLTDGLALRVRGLLRRTRVEEIHVVSSKAAAVGDLHHRVRVDLRRAGYQASTLEDGRPSADRVLHVRRSGGELMHLRIGPQPQYGEVEQVAGWPVSSLGTSGVLALQAVRSRMRAQDHIDLAALNSRIPGLLFDKLAIQWLVNLVKDPNESMPSGHVGNAQREAPPQVGTKAGNQENPKRLWVKPNRLRHEFWQLYRYLGFVTQIPHGEFAAFGLNEVQSQQVRDDSLRLSTRIWRNAPVVPGARKLLPDLSNEALADRYLEVAARSFDESVTQAKSSQHHGRANPPPWWELAAVEAEQRRRALVQPRQQSRQPRRHGLQRPVAPVASPRSRPGRSL